MKHLLIIFIATFFISCDQNDNLLYRELGLTGNVQSIKERHYEVEQKFGEILKAERADVHDEFLDDGEFKYWIETNSKFIEDPISRNKICRLSDLLSTIRNDEFDIYFNKDGTVNSLKSYENFSGWKGNERLKHKMTFNSIQDLEEYNYYSNGSLQLKVKYNYHDLGKLENISYYDKQGDLISKMIYKYGIERDVLVNIYSQDGVLIGKTTYDLDSQERPEQSIYQSETHEILTKRDFNYDSNGNLIKVKGVQNKMTFGGDYTYDKNGNLLTSNCYSNDLWDGDNILETIKFHYKYKDDRVIKIVCTRSRSRNKKNESTRYYKYEYFYDENNLLKTKKVYRGNKLVGNVTCDYTLDSHNNWTKMIYSLGFEDELPKPIYIIEREITYYN